MKITDQDFGNPVTGFVTRFFMRIGKGTNPPADGCSFVWSPEAINGGFGEGGTGWPLKYRQRGGGYYFNVGCSELIIDGKVGLIQYDAIERFTDHGIAMKDGGEHAADLVVLATGYKGLEHVVGAMFGDAVAQRVGPIWGFDPDTQELRNMWTRTGQPGLWFTAGAFSQCRIYSKYLALQIKAVELGLIEPSR